MNMKNHLQRKLVKMHFLGDNTSGESYIIEEMPSIWGTSKYLMEIKLPASPEPSFSQSPGLQEI